MPESFSAGKRAVFPPEMPLISELYVAVSWPETSEWRRMVLYCLHTREKILYCSKKVLDKVWEGEYNIVKYLINRRKNK